MYGNPAYGADNHAHHDDHDEFSFAPDLGQLLVVARGVAGTSVAELTAQDERREEADGECREKKRAREEGEPQRPELDRVAAGQQVVGMLADERLLEDGAVCRQQQRQVRADERAPYDDTGNDDIRAGQHGRRRPAAHALAAVGEDARDDERVDDDVDRHEHDVVHELARVHEPRVLRERQAAGHVVDGRHRHGARDEHDVRARDVRQHQIRPGAHALV